MRRSKGWGGARRGSGRKKQVQKPKRITIDVEAEEAATLKQIAEQRGTSVSKVARAAIGQYLKRLRRG